MKNGMSFTSSVEIDALIARIKMSTGEHISTQGMADLKTVSDLLLHSDAAFLDAVHGDRAATSALIRLLAHDNAVCPLSNLLANLEIPHSDTELLATVVGAGLGGDVGDTHKWLVDYDVVGQRLEMIRSVVLPYVETHCREKTLFRALKEYEAKSLALNTVLVDPVEIHRLVGAVREAAPVTAEPMPGRSAGASIRLVLPNEVFNILLRLAWTAQDYVFDLYERYAPDQFIAMLGTLEKVVPVYLIPTHLGYPMGGGESFLYQTCRILSEMGIRCVWVSYLDPKSGWYTASSRTHTPYYLDVRRGGGCSKEAIQQAVDEFKPDLIHAQGGTSDVAMEIAEQNRLTTMIGYHFWNGLAELGASGNQHILENIDQHALRVGAPPQSRLIHKYVASEFMQEVYERLGGKEKLQVIHPISDAAQFLAERDGLGEYVLQVNVCRLKGGDIFRDCVKALGDSVPFMGVRSEPGDNGYYDALQADVDARPLSKVVSYGNVRDFYRNARIVIVPTLVDETFCRVAFEAAMNGIPVLSTANGYLPSMLGDTGVFLPESSDAWIDYIRDLYHDKERLRRIGEAQRARLTAMFGSDFSGFISSAMGLVDSAATRNIGIFTVWGDLGLGNLSHVHAKLLRAAGYKVHIFSFQPYGSIGKGLVRQQNPEDWSVPRNADSVYYSFNHREEVTVYELSQFILANNVHTLLVPEVCWQPNWDRLLAIKINKLKICTIPMIEIVIRDEIPYHNRLASTLFCTRLSEHALIAHGVYNGAFLGFGIGRPLPAERLQAKRERLATSGRLRFLHIAGHNPRTRKNTPQVMEAFAKALALRDDIELTVTSMDPLSSYYPHELPSGITVIDHSLGREEILALYEEHDVSIQVSSHEGLGLGFYESISCGTPVVSLDAPPHNEIVLEGETGWLIPAQAKAMPDNDRSIVSAWRFDTFALTERIVSLERGQVDEVTAASQLVYRTRFDEVALLTRFLQVLPKTEVVAPPQAAEIQAPSEAQLREEGIVTADISAVQFTAPPAVEYVQTAAAAPAPGGAKIFIKRVLYKLIRRAYHSAKPLTRRVAVRLRTLMVEATDDLRLQMRTLSNTQAAHSHDLYTMSRSLHDEVRALAREQSEQYQVLRQAMEALQTGQEAFAHGQAQYNGELSVVAKALRNEARNMAAAGGEQNRILAAIRTLADSVNATSEEKKQILAAMREITERAADTSVEKRQILAAMREVTESAAGTNVEKKQILAAMREASDNAAAASEEYKSILAAMRDATDSASAAGAQQQQAFMNIAGAEREMQGTLELVNRNITFVKERMASYAGPGTVLTYLRDESPLFVNTGDLGCPSPIVNGGVWEPENLAILQSFVTSDTVFLDVGANVGYFSIAIGNRLGKGGQVFAIEPHPALTNLIERSIHLNSLEGVVTVARCAVSDRAGVLDLFYPDDHLGRGTASLAIDAPGRKIQVSAQRLDEVVPAGLAVDLVKIDVEGHELQVLHGMEDILRRSPGIKILFEKLAGAPPESDAIAALLSGHGLALYGVGPNAVLVPLDGDAYGAWVGDVFAAPAVAVTRLDRNCFSVYPGQLSGQAQQVGSRSRYQADTDAILFFGPDWHLAAGQWEVKLHAGLEAPLFLIIVEEHRRVLAELELTPDQQEATFVLDHDVAHFELRGSVRGGGAVELKRIEFRRVR